MKLLVKISLYFNTYSAISSVLCVLGNFAARLFLIRIFAARLFVVNIITSLVFCLADFLHRELLATKTIHRGDFSLYELSLR